jgi:hypothetical protein
MSDIFLLARGPFAGQIDPFAGAAYYFSQLHSGIIGGLLSQIWQPLLERGYIASKEASLQITEIRKPDIAVRVTAETTQSEKSLDYAAAAAAILAEPGISIELDEPELQAIFIRRENRLVTVVEVISPRNKTYLPDMVKYQEGRSQLFLEQGVNVVEIDLTRSVKRLFEHGLTLKHPYHVAVFIVNEPPRIIPMNLGEPLKRCALPLVDDVVGMDLQAAYDTAYREATIAPQLESNRHYTADYLPFPSLITDEQIRHCLQAVETWRAALKSS